jgi:hypothetical protein
VHGRPGFGGAHGLRRLRSTSPPPASSMCRGPLVSRRLADQSVTLAVTPVVPSSPASLGLRIPNSARSKSHVHFGDSWVDAATHHTCTSYGEALFRSRAYFGSTYRDWVRCIRTTAKYADTVDLAHKLVHHTTGEHAHTYAIRASGPTPARYVHRREADQSDLTTKVSLRSWNSPVQVSTSSSTLVSRTTKWPEPPWAWWPWWWWRPWLPVRDALSTSSNFSLTTCCWTPPWRPKPAGLATDLTSSEQ